MCNRLFLLLLLLSMFPPMTWAAAPAESSPRPVDLLLQVQKRYQQVHSLEFHFSQLTHTGGRTREGSGNAVFFRPQAPATPNKGKGLMRWDYTSPTEQTIINDGRELSIYTPQDRQLVISPVQDLESDVTYAIFTGTRSLPDTFITAPPDPSFHLSDLPGGAMALLLTPKEPHSQIKRAQLWLKSDHTIQRVLMEDHFGTLTELTFSGVRINRLPAGDPRQVETLLKLEIPDGTEIIRQ